MRLKRAHKWLISLLFAVLALLLLFVNAVLVWVVTGPRSLDALTPYVESALTPPGSAYEVRIGTSELIWDGWQRPVGIHAKNVSVVGSKGEIIATLPEIGVQMYFFDLLRGRLNVKSLEVLHPMVVLSQADDGSIAFGFSTAGNVDSANTSLAGALALLTSDEGDNPVTHMKAFSIEHANVSIRKGQTGVFLQSADATLEVTRKHGDVKGLLTMPLRYNQKNSDITIDFALLKDSKTLNGSLIYTDIPSAVLHALFPAQHWLDSITMPLSGWANVASDFDANVSALNFVLDAGPGTVAYAGQLEAPLNVKHIHVAGSLTDKLSTLTVREGVIDFKSVNLKFKGTANKQGDDYAVEANVETGNVPADDVHLYWPLQLAPHTRDWVTRHISKGTLTRGSAALHFKHGDFKLKDTPEEAVDATLEVKNATVKYMPSHPAATGIDGTVRFTGKSMDAQVSHAQYMTGTEITSAGVRFPDLNAADVRLFMDMDIKAPARDVVDFLSLPELNKAKDLNLTTAATGRASGNAKLDFIAFSDNEKYSVASGHFNYAVNADLIDVSQPKFMNKYDIAGADVKVNLSNKGVKVAGRAKVNLLPMGIDLTTSFGKDSATSYQIKTDMPVARLPDFGLPALNFAKGTMAVNANFITSDASPDKADATLDLARTSIDLPKYGYSKKLGEDAMVKLSTEQAPNGNTLISSFLLTGEKGSTASGKAEYDKKLADFSSFGFDRLRVGNHDLSRLDYVRIPGGFRLSARGRALDAAPFISPSKNDRGDEGYNLDIKVDNLLLGEKRGMHDVTITADCGDICRSALITAKLQDNTPFNYSVSDGKLLATCDNGGELLGALGFSDNITGGKMALEGAYNKGKMEGVMAMKDYTLRRAPVLTKIFTIASLTGILDTLSGNGIAFTKLSAPFVYGHDTLILKDAKTHGSALGITADGTIDMRAGKIDLTGTLVPSYTLNSLVGNIPLIGDLLMGGTGKGIIGINYSVKGDVNDPSVSVNPLSVLTPGFLRNVFDVFDQPAPDIDKIEADRKKAAADAEKAKQAVPATPPAAR